MTSRWQWPALLFLLSATLANAAPTPFGDKIRSHRVAREGEWMDEFLRFIALPNTSADRPSQRKNAEFIVAMMQRRGIGARLLDAKAPGSPPVVYGEIKTPGATRTVVYYAHYDGTAVNPAQWSEGWQPFQPRFVTGPAEQGGKFVANWKPGMRIDPEWRVTGRSAADDKAGVMAILNAYAAVAQSGARLTTNLKFFFDGEEESGSPNLRELLTTHADLLRSDLWIIADGPVHMSGQKLVQFGVRGSVNLGLTVYGPKRPLHSGHYGNWAPNPAQVLVNLLASMKDDQGRVLIPDFYADAVPLSASERQALAAIPSPDAALQRELGISGPETPGRSLLESLHLPSLNINGIQSANVGPAATNVIPISAKVVLNLRLVLGNDAKRQVEKVVAHIRARGFTALDREPTEEDFARQTRLIRVEKRGGYNAQRTPLDLPIAQAVVAAVQSTVDYPVIQLPSAGGSLPLVIIEEVLGAKVISVPIVNYDSNQHAENENVKVQFLWDGIESYAALMTML
jgi:acetylornithine deacetylase/succinyl-diaminopimelate desuccinylase-like protein